MKNSRKHNKKHKYDNVTEAHLLSAYILLIAMFLISIVLSTFTFM